MRNLRSVCIALAIALVALPCAVALAQPAAAPSTVAPPVKPLGPGDATGAPARSAERAAADKTAASQEYLLGPEDVVEIEVLGTNDKTRARIYTDGTLQANLIGKISGAGRTPRELGADIAKALKAGGYYADPVVNVEVTNYASRYVTVLGAVGNPGLVPINRPYRLSEIMARVGGVREGAADYVVVHPEQGEEKHYNVDKLSSGGPDDDPFVAPGDKIFSPTAELFYIQGQVHGPGAYPVRTDMTVGQAIARAGGLTDSGNDKSIKVRRGGKDLKLNTSAKVEPGDVLTVSERLF
jgi:polysaccharide export outer membrane protein